MPLIETIREAKRSLGELFAKTRAEVVVGGATLGFAGLLLAYSHEAKRERYIPIAFSEIEQLEDTARAHNRELDPVTKYYAMNNDMLAKVFEAWNDPSMFPRLNQREWFAYKLDQVMDTTQKLYRYNLRELGDSVPQVARRALARLRDLQTVRDGMHAVNGHFDRAWDYSYHDNTHEECHQECTSYTDSEGHEHESCETICVTVCDSRDHRWTYHPQEGSAADRSLAALAQRQPTIAYIDMPVPPKVKAWNWGVIREELRVKHKRDVNDEDSLLTIAQTFKTGSVYEQNIKTVIGNWLAMQQRDAPAWHMALRTARTTSDRTFFCGPTAGPAEYELARAVAARGEFLEQKATDILTPMTEAATRVPAWIHGIKQYYVAETGFAHHYPELAPADRKGVNARRLMKSTLNNTIAMYVKNYPRGLDVQQFRPGVLLLGAFAGALLGMALGAGVDYLNDRRLGQPTLFDEMHGY